MSTQKSPIITSEEVKYPYQLILAQGDFSSVQSRVKYKIVEAIQDRVNNYLAHIEDRKKSGQQYLFDDDDFDTNGEYTISIPLSEVATTSGEYNEIEASVMKLGRYLVDFDEIVDGKVYKSQMQLFRVSVPKSVTENEIRCGHILIHIDRRIAHQFFHMIPGYVMVKALMSYDKRIKPSTNRMFELLSKHFQGDRDTVKYNYKELRKLTGASYDFLDIVKDEDGKPVLVGGVQQYETKHREKYPRFKDYRKFLDAAQLQMKTLLRDGHCKFAFNYKAEWTRGVERGDPQNIIFSRLLTADIAEEVHETPQKGGAALEAWNRFVEHSKQYPGVYETWTRVIEVVSATDNELVLKVPSNTFVQMWYDNFKSTPLVHEYNDLIHNFLFRLEK